MSYQVLSRKWRPQIFDDVIGQYAVIQTLKNAIKEERVGHGFLFSGLRGIGKTTTARILAKALNCRTPIEQSPCNNCNNCKDITTGKSMDVLEIDGASNRGIDEIRELREAVKYPPSAGQFRIYIIDEVHMLTKQAFNALLKTLEEPPQHVKFIMATTDPQKVPQTIHSRTLNFNFRRVSLEVLVNHLEKIILSEKIKYDDLSLQLIARKADGSVRDALSLLDQSIVYSGEKLNSQAVTEVLGIIPESLYYQVLEKIIDKDFNVVALIHDSLKGVISIGDFISGFNQFLTQSMLVLTQIKTDLEISNKIYKKINSNKNFQVLDVLRIHEQTQNFELKLRYLKFPLFSFDSLIIKLLSMESTVSINSLLMNKKNLIQNKTLKDVKGKKKNNKIEINPEENNIQDSQLISNSNKLQESEVQKKSENDNLKISQNRNIDFFIRNWDDFLNLVQSEHPKYITYLNNTLPDEFIGNILKLKISSGDSFQLSGLEKSKSKLEVMLSDYSGQTLKLKFEKNIENQNAEFSVENKSSHLVKEHPLFEKVMETFDGEVLRN